MPFPDAPRNLLAALAAAEGSFRTPALVVDLDAARHNVETLAATIGPDRWMPHVKTLKQGRLVDLLLDAGVRALKAATLDEADLVLSRARGRGLGVEVLLAHPAHGANLADALARTEPGGGGLSLLADSPGHLHAIARAARRRPPHPVSVWLDLDVGMHRTGSPPETWRRAWASPPPDGVRIRGLSAYEGHIGWGDGDSAMAIYGRLAEIARALGVTAVVTSGTPSFTFALSSPHLSAAEFQARVSPGTAVLCDLRSAGVAAHHGLRQAAFVATRVVSAPTPGLRTCDAGSKAVAPDCPLPSAAVAGHPELRPVARSEEHLVLAVEAPTDVAPGDLLLLVPEHVCTTVNLYRQAIYVAGNEVTAVGAVEAAARWTVPDAARHGPAAGRGGP